MNIPAFDPSPRDVLVGHLPALRRWCYRRSGDLHLAEDVTQETALTALAQLDRLRDPTRLRPWLYTIAQRRMVDEVRRRRVLAPIEPDLTPAAPARHGDDGGGGGRGGGAVVRGLGAGVGSGASAVAASRAAGLPWDDEREAERASLLRVQATLRRLPLPLRRAVRMHYLQGRPIRDVARSLHTTVNGVKARLYRARRLLRAEAHPERGHRTRRELPSPGTPRSKEAKS